MNPDLSTLHLAHSASEKIDLGPGGEGLPLDTQGQGKRDSGPPQPAVPWPVPLPGVLNK